MGKNILTIVYEDLILDVRGIVENIKVHKRNFEGNAICSELFLETSEGMISVYYHGQLLKKDMLTLYDESIRFMMRKSGKGVNQEIQGEDFVYSIFGNFPEFRKFSSEKVSSEREDYPLENLRVH